MRHLPNYGRTMILIISAMHIPDYQVRQVRPDCAWKMKSVDCNYFSKKKLWVSLHFLL
jgi:hypothetical protein